MSFNIETDVVMPQNYSLAFKANTMQRMAQSARMLHELGADVPSFDNIKETLLQKIKRNIFFRPEQQEYVKQLNRAVMDKDKKTVLLVNQLCTSDSIFSNIIGNLRRMLSK